MAKRRFKIRPGTDDPVELAFDNLCDIFDLEYVRPDHSDNPKGRLDFYLPYFDLYVEVKAHSCERLHEQLESVAGKPVIALIGKQSVDALYRLLARVEGNAQEILRAQIADEREEWVEDNGE